MDNPILLHQAIALIDRFPDATRHTLTQAHRDDLLAMLHVVEVAGREGEMNTLRVAVETLFALGYEAGRGAAMAPAQATGAAQSAPAEDGATKDAGEEGEAEEREMLDELSARRRQRETPEETPDTPTDFE